MTSGVVCPAKKTLKQALIQQVEGVNNDYYRQRISACFNNVYDLPCYVSRTL